MKVKKSVLNYVSLFMENTTKMWFGRKQEHVQIFSIFVNLADDQGLGMDLIHM